MEIISHRGNLEGPCHAKENSLAAISEAAQAGFGVELDLRLHVDGRWYLSHDPLSQAETAVWLDDNLKSLIGNNSHLQWAINIKAIHGLPELATLTRECWFHRNCFYFDFELLEPSSPGSAQRTLTETYQLDPVHLASRLSDHNEPLSQCIHIYSRIVWADEFESPWLTTQDALKVHQANKLFFWVSPELHGANDVTRQKRWAEAKTWGLDAICTDYPMEAKSFFK